MSNFKEKIKDPIMCRNLNRVAKKFANPTNIIEAGDLLDETYVKAIEKQHLFKDGNLTAWMITMMRRIYIDEFRKSKKERATLDSDKDVSEPKRTVSISDDGVKTIKIERSSDEYQEKTPERTFSNFDNDDEDEINRLMNDSLIDNELLAHKGNFEERYDIESNVENTKAALKKLGKKCQEILLLIAEEYKYKEISKTLSIPMGTVMSRLTRCRKQLHKELYG